MAFSSCLGEGVRWSAAVKGSSKPYFAAWTRSGHQGSALYETIGQLPTEAKATSAAKKLVRETIRDCQGSRSPYDFHYGSVTTDPVGTGFAMRALSYHGRSTKPDGGVVVVVNGTEVEFLSYAGLPGDPEPTNETIAKVAVNRLR